MQFKYRFLAGIIWFFCSWCSSLQAYDYKISIAAIFRDEAPYLCEWIEYHKLLGVEHFYLYNNLSHDNYREVLAPYISKGEVDLIEWTNDYENLGQWDQCQIAAYNNALQLAKNRTKWLAIIDIDEFLVPVGCKKLSKLLSNYKDKPNIGGVCIPWVFFGTSGVEKIPADKLLIETLTLNGGPAADGNISAIWSQGAYKSIVRPEFVRSVVSPHYCVYVPGREHRMIGFESAQINHYWTRDEYYLHQFKIPRRVSWGQSVDTTVSYAAGMNKETPFSRPIRKFIPSLRKRMGID